MVPHTIIPIMINSIILIVTKNNALLIVGLCFFNPHWVLRRNPFIVIYKRNQNLCMLTNIPSVLRLKSVSFYLHLITFKQ